VDAVGVVLLGDYSRLRPAMKSGGQDE